jgi:hypothetical protein
VIVWLLQTKRSSLEGDLSFGLVVAAHEVIHDVVKKESGFIFKLDYEKSLW